MIKKHIEESIAVKQAFLADEKAIATLSTVTGVIVEAYRKGAKTIWAGNGGSAADAQHMAAELVNKFLMERPGLPAVSLTVDTSILTSIGNDFGYERVFARQLDALGREGDVFIGFSTSGNSANLMEALQVCREKGVISVAIVGGKPCKMDAFDYVIHVPSFSTPRIQECQTLIGHIICYCVEKNLFAAR